MSPLLIIAIAFVVLTLMGVPLFVAVGITTGLALYLIDIPYTLLAQTGYSSLTPFPLLTIPLFVLAGRLMEVGGMANRMIGIATKLVGAYRGSMGLVTVFACMDDEDEREKRRGSAAAPARTHQHTSGRTARNKRHSISSTWSR